MPDWYCNVFSVATARAGGADYYSVGALTDGCCCKLTVDTYKAIPKLLLTSRATISAYNILPARQYRSLSEAKVEYENGSRDKLPFPSQSCKKMNIVKSIAAALKMHAMIQTKKSSCQGTSQSCVASSYKAFCIFITVRKEASLLLFRSCSVGSPTRAFTVPTCLPPPLTDC